MHGTVGSGRFQRGIRCALRRAFTATQGKKCTSMPDCSKPGCLFLPATLWQHLSRQQRLAIFRQEELNVYAGTSNTYRGKSLGLWPPTCFYSEFLRNLARCKSPTEKPLNKFLSPGEFVETETGEGAASKSRFASPSTDSGRTNSFNACVNMNCCGCRLNHTCHYNGWKTHPFQLWFVAPSSTTEQRCMPVAGCAPPRRSSQLPKPATVAANPASSSNRLPWLLSVELPLSNPAGQHIICSEFEGNPQRSSNTRLLFVNI